MKVLISSVFKDGTGYSHGAINIARACNAAGIDVVCRSISLTSMIGRDDAKHIEEFEKKDLNNVDANIQIALPHMFEYQNRCINIGYFFYETTNFIRSGWSRNLNLMNGVWNPCLVQNQACINSKVVSPTNIIQVPCDQDKFSKEYNNINLGGVDRDRIVFYTIAENNRRKNLPNLIRSYFYAFGHTDRVLLVIKTNTNISQTINDIKKETHEYCNNGMYPKILVISSRMSNEDICCLHNTGDVFVTASKGESACIPAIDAIGFGNPCIGPNWGSLPDLLCNQASYYFSPEHNLFKPPGDISTGWLVNGQLAPCFGQNTGIKNLYNGKELWFEVNMIDMAMAMRDAYNRWMNKKLQPMRDAAKKRSLDFSYEKVGAVIRDTLEKLLNV